MITFLTSSPTRELSAEWPDPIFDAWNGFVRHLKEVWPFRTAAMCWSGTKWRPSSSRRFRCPTDRSPPIAGKMDPACFDSQLLCRTPAAAGVFLYHSCIKRKIFSPRVWI